jgi:predicted lipoprotein
MIANNNTALNAGLPFGGPAFAFFGFALLVLSGCDPDRGTDSTDFDRSAYLIHTADELIVPSYEDFASDASSLYDVFVALESGTVTSENVIALREGLRTANISWQQAQLFDFGPAITRALLVTTNTYPTDTSEIVAACFAGSWTGGLPATLNSSGLPALDWMLFKGDETEVADWFNESGSGALAHAVRLAEFMRNEADAVLNAWNTEYRDEFIASTGTEAGSSVGEFLNAFNRVFEGNIRKQKLGLPNGAMTFSQTPQPSLVEAPYAGNWSVDLLTESLRAAARAYFGDRENGSTQALGLDDYLKSLGNVEFGQGLHEDISAQLASAQTAVLLLEDPLAEFVVNQQATSFDVYSELQALVVLWKVDMMSSLGVLITYFDNDGD